MYHFYLALTNDDVRPMMTPFLPRVGDTVIVDGDELVIDKVTWFSNGHNIQDEPLLNVVSEKVIYDQAAGTTSSLAETLARRHGQNGTKKIQTIKELRAVTGCSLKEAKESIDQVWIKLGWASQR